MLQPVMLRHGMVCGLYLLGGLLLPLTLLFVNTYSHPQCQQTSTNENRSTKIVLSHCQQGCEGSSIH